MPPSVSIPEEIDVFTIPHSRMKELVNTYYKKIDCVDFNDCLQVNTLLHELNSIFYEFKSHESIENMFIMDQLKNRLKQKHIHNSAVCDCHNDSRITDMMKLVRSGQYLVHKGDGERESFGLKLRERFDNFVQQFLPHMEEEENIFQPLLVEHFAYDELKILKEVVLEQHELLKNVGDVEKASVETCETDEAIKDCRDLDENTWNLTDLFEESDRESGVEKEMNIFDLPEIAFKIFGYLEPPDRGRCAQVCSQWNRYIYSNCLWKEVYPIQWARGIWVWKNLNLNLDLEDKAALTKSYEMFKCLDEDADLDESEFDVSDPFVQEQRVFQNVISNLLSRVGSGVKTLIMDSGCGIPSRMIKDALLHCTNITKFSAAYTKVNYYTFKGLWEKNCLQKLEELNLQGCSGVDDQVLSSLSLCFDSKNFDRQCRLKKSRCPRFVNGRCADILLPFGSNSCSCNKSGCNQPNKSSFNRKKTIYYSNGTIRNTNMLSTISALYSSALCYKMPTLKSLNLSGCFKVNGNGLLNLSDSSHLLNLRYLNLSGCFQIPANLLSAVLFTCPNLKPKDLSYCDAIAVDKYDTEAGGCDSIEHPLKVCCRSFVN